jgi:hypothetical protein
MDDENYARIHDLTSYNTQFGDLNPSDLQDWQQTAADYAMHVHLITAKKSLNPAGEWNSAEELFSPLKM